jgi:uncharacterized membrane protein
MQPTGPAASDTFEQYRMKTAGMVIALAGVLLVLVGLSLGVTKYDLHSPRDLRQFLGGVVGWGLVAVVGIILFVVGSGKSKNKGR